MRASFCPSPVAPLTELDSLLALCRWLQFASPVKCSRLFGLSALASRFVRPWSDPPSSGVRVSHVLSLQIFFVWFFRLVKVFAGWSRYISWVIGSKDLRFCGLNCSPAVVFRMHPPVVWWNTCEDINYFFGSIFIVDLARDLASTVPCFPCVS
jgi:hypothetical protein